ncbi:hypothetical protein [Neobacillus sp. 19]|uniref:hypothetical protein n=1 Tax=Neobacillus sp. 19 TaxID=3394458 RepID=UPI003C2DBB95
MFELFVRELTTKLLILIEHAISITVLTPFYNEERLVFVQVPSISGNTWPWSIMGVKVRTFLLIRQRE